MSKRRAEKDAVSTAPRVAKALAASSTSPFGQLLRSPQHRRAGELAAAAAVDDEGGACACSHCHRAVSQSRVATCATCSERVPPTGGGEQRAGRA